MDEIIKNLDAQLINGKVYTTPGETTKERENSGYCMQAGSHCHTCSLVNYGRDCRNNPVEDAECCRKCQMTDNWEFDREGRIAGWERDEGIVCPACATETDGDPVTMEDAGYNTICISCGKRIA